MQSETIASSVQRSPFVTGLAWLFIVTSGFGMVISLLQNAMFYFLVPHGEMEKALQQAQEQQQMPEAMAMAFGNIEGLLLVMLVVVTLTLVASIALLKRKNWARLVFIGLMALGIVWNIAGAAMQFAFTLPIPQEMQVPPEFETMMQMMKIVTVLFAAGFSVLMGWVIKKLCSEEIRAEFA